MFRRYPRVCACSVFAGCLAVLACGDGDGDTSTVTLTVDHEKPLSELTLEERQEICQTGRAVVSEVIGPTVCALSGILAQSAERTCEAASKECLVQLRSPEGKCVAPKQAACDVTVGEVEGCMNALAPLVQAKLPQIDCKTSAADLLAVQADLREVTEVLEDGVPPACEGLYTSCEDFDFGMSDLGADIGTMFGSELGEEND